MTCKITAAGAAGHGVLISALSKRAICKKLIPRKHSTVFLFMCNCKLQLLQLIAIKNIHKYGFENS